jgi:hypothetical protein
MAIVLITLVSCALVVWFWSRNRSPQQRLGTEYDRHIAQSESRLATERELRDRHRRHATLKFSELSPQAREGHAMEWRKLQPHFASSAHEAVNDADDLVTRLIAELGYPAGDYYEQLAQMSAEHGDTLQAYREAHQISLSNRRGEATAEQLRLAVMHFSTLVPQLLGEQPAPSHDVSTHPAGQHPDRRAAVVQAIVRSPLPGDRA